jgi:hypothetical protein
MTIRQLKMLDEIVRRRGLSIAQAEELNQNIFGSICYRKWVQWNVSSERFEISSDGREARQQVNEWELHRQFNNHQLSVRVKCALPHRGLRRIA